MDAPKGILDRESSARVALIQEERDDPSSDGLRRVRERIFGETALGYSPLGRSKDLEEVTPSHMIAFGSRILALRKHALAISGEFDPIWAKVRVGELFFAGTGSGSWDRGCKSGLVEPFAEVIRHAREQSVVLSSFQTGGIEDEFALTRQLALSCLNGLSGPLFEEIRERHGLAYYSYARLVAGRDRGLIAFISGCEESKAQFLLDRLGEILMRLGVRGFSKDEFESGRSQSRSALLMSRQRTSWRCQRLAIRWIQGLDPDLGEAAEMFLDKVDRPAVQEWCASHLLPDDGSTLFLLPQADANNITQSSLTPNGDG
jgi:predicted Zn-dependent peptidase